MNKLFTAFVILTLLNLCGCGGSSTSVTGKVTYKGKPAGNCSLTLVGADGVVYSEITKADGTFTFEKIPVGSVQVGLHSPAPRDAAKVKMGKEALVPRDGMVASTNAEATVTVDPKFAIPASSGIIVEIKKGQPLNIDVS